MRPLYTIDKYEYEDAIRGMIYKSQLLIAKELGPIHNTVVTLEKLSEGNLSVYSMNVEFVGSDGRYMDEIILNIDGEITSLIDDDPGRILKSGGTVIESVSCFLDENTFKGLRFCESLVIQYSHITFTIPQEGLEAIWNFLRK